MKTIGDNFISIKFLKIYTIFGHKKLRFRPSPKVLDPDLRIGNQGFGSSSGSAFFGVPGSGSAFFGFPESGSAF